MLQLLRYLAQYIDIGWKWQRPSPFSISYLMILTAKLAYLLITQNLNFKVLAWASASLHCFCTVSDSKVMKIKGKYIQSMKY